MTVRKLEFGTAKAGAGEKAAGILRVGKGREAFTLGVAVVNGKREGEHVVAVANQHGGEVNGLESLRLFFEQVDPRRVAGSVFLVFSANPRAAMLGNEFYPEDVDAGTLEKFRGGRNREPGFDRNACRWNMNRRWPGEPDGTLVDRAVHEIWTRAVTARHRKASLFLDYHCHGRPSAVYAAFREDIDIGIASGIPVVIFTRSGSASVHRHRFSFSACLGAGIQSLTIELGGQGRMVPRSIEDGRRAIFNLLRFWGMLPGPGEYYPEPTIVLDPWRNDIEKRPYASPSYLFHKAGHDGLAVFRREPYGRVRKGDPVCHVVDPYTGRVVEEHRAGMSGVLSGSHEGGAVCRAGDNLFTVSIARWINPREHARKLDPDSFRGPGAKWTA